MVQTAEKSRVASYRDLQVWQKGLELAKVIYAITKPFPTEEKFGLVSQMRRAAISVPSNIAEGQARKSTAKFIHFISTAEGSLAELDTQLTLCSDLGFCSAANGEEAFGLISELKKMLNALRRRLSRAD
ncbi:MAG TPA: four helix bundle protein [Terriglobia bacterium]|nr:four helix bundle protein [Terriglobia bacterium]